MSISECMVRAFKGVDGFQVSSGSSSAKLKKTYGEILPKGMNKLCERIEFEDDDYFVDLGSGVGKMTVRVFLSLETGVKSLGIEIDRELFDLSIRARSKLQHKRIDNLNFLYDDIKHISNWKNATIIFSNALSFDEEMREFLVKTLLTHNRVRCVILVGFFPISPLPSWRVSRVEESIIPMTWVDEMPVSISWLVPVDKIPPELFQLEEDKAKKIQEAREKLEQDIKNRLERAMSLVEIDENSTQKKKRTPSSNNFCFLKRQSSFVPVSSPSLEESILEP